MSRCDTEVHEVRRLEVINGEVGRRTWTTERKGAIVAESMQPDVVVSEVARRHDLTPQQLFAWRHDAKQGRLALPEEAMSFVPVVATANDDAPIANEALLRIQKLYRIEKEIRGQSAEARRKVRQAKAKPIVEALRPWLEHQLERVSSGSTTAGAIRYTLNHWDRLLCYLDDGRIEIDSNTVERSIRPLALSRKNALFGYKDAGGERWAILASLIETCKLNNVDPQAWMTDVLTRLVNGHRMSEIDDLLPWRWAANQARLADAA